VKGKREERTHMRQKEREESGREKERCEDDKKKKTRQREENGREKVVVEAENKDGHETEEREKKIIF
jgi:hypothetical protein